MRSQTCLILPLQRGTDSRFPSEPVWWRSPTVADWPAVVVEVEQSPDEVLFGCDCRLLQRVLDLCTAGGTVKHRVFDLPEPGYRLRGRLLRLRQAACGGAGSQFWRSFLHPSDG